MNKHIIYIFKNILKKMSEKNKEYLHIIKWDVSIDKQLPIPKGSTKLAASFIGPIVVMNKNVYLNSIYDLYGYKYLKDVLKNFVLNYCKTNKVKCTGEILAYITKDEFDQKLSNRQVKIKIAPDKIDFIPCSINIHVTTK